MSEFYFNEKKGRYEPISEAPFGAYHRSEKISKDDLADDILRAEQWSDASFASAKTGHFSADIENDSRQSNRYESYQGTQSSESRETPKKKKGGVISFAVIVWIIYMLFKGELGESIRQFFEDVF